MDGWPQFSQQFFNRRGSRLFYGELWTLPGIDKFWCNIRWPNGHWPSPATSVLPGYPCGVDTSELAALMPECPFTLKTARSLCRGCGLWVIRLSRRDPGNYAIKYFEPHLETGERFGSITFCKGSQPRNPYLKKKKGAPHRTGFASIKAGPYHIVSGRSANG